MRTKQTIRNFVTRTVATLAGRTTRRLAMTLLVLMMTTATAWSQSTNQTVSLPFTEDFEKGIGSWQVLSGDEIYTGIWDVYKQTKAFAFWGNGPQYLITPRIDCPAKIKVTLYYAINNKDYPKSFQVGYSTSTNDPSAFTWDDEVTATVFDYKKYEHTFPAGTTYVAVKYTSNNNWFLYIDDFSIFVDGVLPPAQLSTSSIASESVTLTWDAVEGATGYVFQYKKANEIIWSDEVMTTATSATISNLTADTDYDVRMKTIVGSNASIYTTTRFVTATEVPYDMNFESGMGRWTMVDCDIMQFENVSDIWGTGRRMQAAHDGNIGFQFSLNSDSRETPQYLISPRFNGDAAITLSFYYRVPTNIAETIYVGYSTTTNDKDAFTFGDAITYNSSNWAKYEHTFPAEARYFAVKYASNEYRMFIDDFCFEKPSSYAKPTTIGYTEISETEATLAWNIPSGATGFVYQYKKANDNTWSAETMLNTNTVTLSELTPNTYYCFRVKALYGSNSSNYSTYSFQTDARVDNLPYSEGFENGMGGWRMADCDGMTRILKTGLGGGSHSGLCCFEFCRSDQHQYLISPHFAGGMPKKVSFYYQNYESYPGILAVGYTNTKTDAITWIDNAVNAIGGAWTLYETTLPATAHYLIISCRKEGNMLYLDDFSFTYEPANVTFAKEGYGTYYNGSLDAVLPEGVKAYIITAPGEGQTLTHLEIADGSTTNNIVPKGTAVMLRTAASDAAQSIDIPLASPTAAAISETNLLHGSDTEITTTGGDAGAKYYKLSYGTYQTGNGGEDLTGVLGWFWGAADGAAFTSAAHKAWLVLPSPAGTRGFFGLPGDDETTLLRKVNSEEVNSEEWFSLDGRRLNGRPSAKGLYIHNGRKVVIK
jgi:hypothetical protein